MTTSEQLAEQLARCSAFARMTEAQRVTLARAAAQVDFLPGATLFAEGEPASGCWLIRVGRVALETMAPARGPIVVQTVGPGDLLGWSWLVPPHHWQFTATASTPVSAIEFDTAQLRAIAEDDPSLGYPLALGLMEALLARLQSTRARVLDLYGSPRARRV